MSVRRVASGRRGQSETVGFILIFALITVSTGVVYVGGFAALDDARSAEQVNNMERAFEVLDDNLQDIARRGAPSRSTEVSLSGGRIFLGETTEITVAANYVSNGTAADNVSIGARPIVYHNDDTEVIYTSEAIIRSDRGDAVMRSEPRWVVTDRRTTMPLLVTSPASEDATSLAGETTILVRGESAARDVAVAVDPPTTRINVTVTVESTRAGVWGRFLEEKGFAAVDGDPTDGTVTYWFETDRLYVPRTAVRIGFGR